MKKELTVKQHMQNIAHLGGKARWKDIKPDPDYFRELQRKSVESKLAKKIKKEIEEESKRNIKVEALKEMIK